MNNIQKQFKAKSALRKMVDSLNAAGQLSSTLAARAMAGAHVGASGSTSSVFSFGQSETVSKNFNYEGGTE